MKDPEGSPSGSFFLIFTLYRTGYAGFGPKGYIQIKKRENFSMRELIGNVINHRSILNNIQNNACPNIILLHGDYGLGKTEFAVDIARMLTCTNLTENGSCGVCKNCTAEISENSFMTSISIINMAKINKEKSLKLVKESTSIIHASNKVYIYDEFHTVPSSDQELWLSASRNLDNTFLILTTTQKRKVDQGIRSRALELKMEKISRSDVDRLLIMYELNSLSTEIKSEMFRVHGGVPRDILISAKFLINSGLKEREMLEFLSKHKKIHLAEIFNMIHNRLLYIQEVKGLEDLYQPGDITKAIEDFVFENLSLGRKAYSRTDIAEIIQYDMLIWILRNASDYKLMFINLLQKLNSKPAGSDKQVVNQITQKTVPKKDTIQRWSY